MRPGAPAAGLDQGHPRKWLILWVVALGMFMALLDSTIVNIAIPAVVTDLKTNISVVSWVLNAYNIGLAVFFLTFGRLADRYGQRLIFVLGIVLFGGFSLACGLAPNIGWLIVFRVGQALGAAAMVPVSLTILMSAFPRHQHGMATALWGVMGSVAAAVGPTLGGVLVQYASWHWIFYVNVPIAVVTLAGTFWLIPEHKRAGEEAGRRPAGHRPLGGGFLRAHAGAHPGERLGLVVVADRHPAGRPRSCCWPASGSGRPRPARPCSTCACSASGRSCRPPGRCSSSGRRWGARSSSSSSTW